MGRTMISTGAAVAAALVAACHPAPLGRPRGAADRPVGVAATLDCPDAEGGLTLSRRAGDGLSCSYAGPGEAQVTLTRMALTGGSPQATLSALDAQARALTPAAPGGAGDASGVPPVPPVPPVPAVPGHDAEHVRLDLPGLHIDADGDRARVSGFGQRVEADGRGAVVHGNVGGLQSSVVANDGGAMVRTGGVGAGSVDAALVLASETPGPDGWRTAGYVARGPLAGPLIVAQVRARGGRDHDHGDPFDAARRLVERNTRR